MIIRPYEDKVKTSHGLPDISLPFIGFRSIDTALAADSVPTSIRARSLQTVISYNLPSAATLVLAVLKGTSIPYIRFKHSNPALRSNQAYIQSFLYN